MNIDKYANEEWDGDKVWRIVEARLEPALTDAFEELARVISDLRKDPYPRWTKDRKDALRKRVIQGAYAHDFGYWKRPDTLSRYRLEEELREEAMDMIVYCAMARWVKDVQTAVQDLIPPADDEDDPLA